MRKLVIPFYFNYKIRAAFQRPSLLAVSINLVATISIIKSRFTDSLSFIIAA
jgi:hypothetical protein